MTTWIRKDGLGQEQIVNCNLPAPSDDTDDYSPLYAAMLKRVNELGLTDGEPITILKLLRTYEDKALDWLEMEGYPEPEPIVWDDDEERRYWDERDRLWDDR